MRATTRRHRELYRHVELIVGRIGLDRAWLVATKAKCYRPDARSKHAAAVRTELDRVYRDLYR
jgi:hypothetical protein